MSETSSSSEDSGPRRTTNTRSRARSTSRAPPGPQQPYPPPSQAGPLAYPPGPGRPPSYPPGPASQQPFVGPNYQNGGQPLPPKPSKRLVLCEDGTWLNSDNNSLKSSVGNPSNVTRISRAIKSLSSDGIPQVVYYHWGVGGGGGVAEKIIGIGGGGLSDIVREGYQYLATNWTPGDEIFIFGFSRGAYSARAIAGLVGDVGLLTKQGLPYLAEIFRDTQHKYDPDYVPKHPDKPFPDKPPFEDPAYVKELVRRHMTVRNVPIKVVGVWDTVGALGVPKVGWLTRLGVQNKTQKELSFYDTALGNNIEYAFQALALDERRYAFQPAVWEKFEGNTTTLRQVWFPGAHANIGGSYEEQQVATISLAWMMAQCQPFLDFDLDYLFDQWDEVDEYYEQRGEKNRPWSFGKIFDGLTGVYSIGGSKIRTPGRYTAVDPTNGKQTHEPLIDTYEYVHPSVRARLRLGGPGLSDRGVYECAALRDWKLIIEEGEPAAKRPDIYWRAREKPFDGFAKILPEAPLKQLEIELLQYDRETRDYVLRPSGVRQRRSQKPKRRSSRQPSR